MRYAQVQCNAVCWAGQLTLFVQRTCHRPVAGPVLWAHKNEMNSPQAHVIGQDAALAVKAPQPGHALKHEGNALALVRAQPSGQHGVHCHRPALATAGLPQIQRLPSVLLLYVLLVNRT